MTTTVPVFLAVERALFVVLGTDRDPVLTWDRDYEVALDFARVHNGIVVPVPVLADYSAAGPFPESADAADAPERVYECPQCGPTRQTGAEHAEAHQAITYLRSESVDADVFELPHRAPTPVVPSATGPEPEPPHIGWAVGDRAVSSPNGWNFERDQEEQEAAGVLAHTRRVAGTDAAQVIIDAYQALGVHIQPEAAEAITQVQRMPPRPETLQRIRDGLRELQEPPVALCRPFCPATEQWEYPHCIHRPNTRVQLLSPCGECILMDDPTVEIFRKAALPPA